MSFVTGRRLMVTGGAGFLGQPVCDALRELDPAEIFVPRRAQFDLRDREAIRNAFDAAMPDVVVHLAAVVGGIGANRNNPGRYFYDNAIMGIQLIEEARRRDVTKFVSVGTVCSYPKFTPVPFREEDLWNGYPEETNAPYGLAKKMLLVQSQAYRQQYGFNGITLLPVNLYGPRDNFDPDSGHVIPSLINNFLTAVEQGKPAVVAWGTGSASREFVFVRDAARAIALATEHYNEPQPMNLGSESEITIRQLASLIRELCGFQGEIHWDHSKPDGQPRRCVDATLARQHLGFTAEISLRDGLIETIAWYKARRRGKAAPLPTICPSMKLPMRPQPRIKAATMARASTSGRKGLR